MVRIREIKCKWINTEALLEEFKEEIENLDLGQGDLRLSSAHSYLFEEVLFENLDFTIEDIAVDECSFVYILGKEKLSGTENPQGTEKSLIFKYGLNTATLKLAGNCPGAFPLKLGKISAIGVDDDTLYIADTPDGSSFRLNAFTKNYYQLRWILSKGPAGVNLKKILDIKCDKEGNIYLLEGKRVLSINKHSPFCPEPTISCEIGEPALPEALEVDKEGNCYVLEVDKEGNRYILEGNAIHVFRAGETEEEKKIDIENFSPSGIAVNAWKEIFVGEAGENGNENLNEKTIHKLGPDDQFYPLWSYRGSCKKLISSPKGRLYVLDGKGEKLTSLIRKKVNLRGPDGTFRGTYLSKPVDSQEDSTIWHRLLINGDFIKGTQIEFFYYLSNEKLSVADIKALEPSRWMSGISETSAVQGDKKRDALFLDNAKGRYLWFKIVLSGTDELSPAVRSIKIFYPRASYVDYLPAIYSKDPYSKDLLERFLSIFESIIFEIDYTIEHIDRFFDADSTPPEFLSWLASWLSVPVDESWTEEKKRLFIRHAVPLYKKRGTREGISESIKLFTGIKPLIVENFRINLPYKGDGHFPCSDEDAIFFPPEGTKVKVGDIEESLVNLLFGKERFAFSVFLRDPGISPTILKQVGRIIDEQKPAHTCYNLKTLEPWFYLDMHTYLGINTALTKPEFILGKNAVIGRDTVLHDDENTGQIERHSRVEIDTILS